MKELCIFYGNCQIINDLYDKLILVNVFKNKYEVLRYVNHDRDNIISLKVIDINKLKKCSLFIYQPLNDKHGVYSTNNIKKYLSIDCKTIGIPYIYNSSFYSIYWEKASPRWTINTLINCGYRNIIKYIKEDISIDKILEMYDNLEIDFYFKERFENCIEILKFKEKECDVKVSDFIINNYKNIKLFVSQNHISDYFRIYIANIVLKLININIILEYPNNIENNKSYDINQKCSDDIYSSNFFNYNYKIYNLSNDIQKDKIRSFYDFFTKNNIEYKNVSCDKNDDPEKFIDLPY